MNLSKSQKRIESKKRKISAFLQVAELNDEEKKRKIIDTDGDDELNSILVKKQDHLPKIVKNDEDSFDDLRRRLKERKQQLKAIPLFEMKTIGANAEIDMPDEFRTPLFMGDAQELFLYTLLGTKAPIEPIRWCKFTRWIHVKGVVCLIVDGVGLRDFVENREGELSSIASFLKHKLEFISPGSYDSKIAQDFSLLPIGNLQRRRLRQKYGDLDKAIQQGSVQRVLRSVFPMKKSILLDKGKSSEKTKSKEKGKPSEEGKVENGQECLKTKLLLSLPQMISEGFPIPLEGELKKKYKNFVMTKSEYTEVNDDSPLFAIDCEMCFTSAGLNELTRICVVDSQLNMIYHSFVKPKNPIQNYLTQYSGITKEMLEGVTTTLEDVQKAISDLLPSDAILVGQSLNSDLIAMQMMHPYIIDTSVIFCVSGVRSRKSKLSSLAKMFLGINIQHEKKDHQIGHDPKEDAEAAMRLVNLKLEKGFSFGDVLLGDGPFPEPEELPPTRKVNDHVLAGTIFNQAKENGQSICIVGEKNILDDYRLYGKEAVNEVEAQDGSEESSSYSGLTYKEVGSSKEAIRQCKKIASEHNLTICHVDLTDQVSHEKLSDTKENRKSISLSKKWIEKIWSKVPINGLFVTIWPGDSEQNAFVGIALNKAKFVG